MIYRFLFTFLLVIDLLVALGQTGPDKKVLASKGKWESPISSLSVSRSGEESGFYKGISYLSDTIQPVHAVFEGEIVLVNSYDSLYMIVVKYGSYYVGYSNLSNPIVKKGDLIKVNQIIANTGENLDGKYAVDIILSSKSNDEINLEGWFKSSQ